MKTIKTLASFEAIVTNYRYVVVILSSDSCPDCHYLDTFTDALEMAHNDIVFVKVKRSDLPMLFTHYNVYGVPSIFFYENAELTDTYIDKNRKTLSMVDAFITQAKKGGNPQ